MQSCHISKFVNNKLIIDEPAIDAKENYANGLKILKKLLVENFHRNADFALEVFERSIDVDCAAKKAKRNNLEELKPIQLLANLFDPINDHMFQQSSCHL